MNWTWKRHVRNLGILLSLSCLSGCATLQGRVQDGIYTSPGGEFSVMVPQILDVETTDGVVGASKRFVDFSMGPYWTAEGSYSVEWYKLDKPYPTDAAFVMETRQLMPTLVKDSLNPSFEPLQTDELKVNGHAAVRLVARGVIGKTDAYWMATSIDLGDRIAVALLLIPVKPDADARPIDPASLPGWGFYPAFTGSITRH
jgi:hypothetical protein